MLLARNHYQAMLQVKESQYQKHQISPIHVYVALEKGHENIPKERRFQFADYAPRWWRSLTTTPSDVGWPNVSEN